MSLIMTRRRFATLAASTAVAAALPLRYANAAEFTFKVGTNVPESHPLNVHLRKASEQIKTETNGQFDLQLFPNNQLGADSDMLSQLRSGAMECFLNSGVNVLSTMIPVAAISGVGFAFKDYPTLWNAMDGKLGTYLRGQITKGGLVVLDKIWDNGFRQTTNSVRPIVKPQDFNGLKIRVPVSALWLSLFRGLGATPTGLNFAEVYSALQTHVVDGQENPPAIISAAKLFEVQKYCSMTNHMWDGWWFLINRRAWSQLPTNLQDKVSGILNTACMAEREEVAQQNNALRKDLEAKGLIFNDVDPAPFRTALSKAGFYTEWRGKFGDEAWNLLEESTGKLS
ncbi:ABC transporter substrate-binding protein [Azorhizobium oxalatiphilum]|uniref:ABC transporter substrate-binding protein n=1 Tax=Azorhizobium oxalatiphilum TaxID=980631 RepID=A0A917BST0_9HYPH|nr:TRAP transporter substrate-binding protein [Azorhizobium oxalatiphilum]GGF55378.1 ABC transporter substrate-binding protein [Azorhizobium oxalatiphilum]